MSQGKTIGTAIAATVTPGLARAECLGACLDGRVAALAAIAVYGILGLVLLVLLIRKSWRRAGILGLAVVAVLALGVPLASQVWLSVKLGRMEAHEVAGAPPPLAGRVPLLIFEKASCDYSACAAVLWGRGNAGTHVLPLAALDGMDLTGPIDLAALPLEFWADAADPGGKTQRRVLDQGERKAAAARIDYLIVAGASHASVKPGPVERGLRANPALAGLSGTARVRLLMAPLDPASKALNLPGLAPDLLDLTLADQALAIPLAPGNTQAAGNAPVNPELVARAVCRVPEAGKDGVPDLFCQNLLDR